MGFCDGSQPTPAVAGGDATWPRVKALFDEVGAVHVRGGSSLARRGSSLAWRGRLRRLARLEPPPAICVERGRAGLTPRETLGSRNPGREEDWYVSLVLKGEHLVRHLRCPQHGIPGVAGSIVCNANHAWVFASSSRRQQAMDGRPEHTDTLAAHVRGTWHLQVSGAKIWHLRRKEGDPKPTAVRCDVGDVLIVDTSAWRHRTTIPAGAAASVSVARDFSYEEIEEQDVGNIDALLASTPLKRGAVVLTEDELPGCSLPRVATPNCEVAERPDGSYCLVAIAEIQTGDPLSVAPTDDEEDEEEDGTSEEEEEEESMGH